MMEIELLKDIVIIGLSVSLFESASAHKRPCRAGP
jgi:hypothetical protein